MGSPWGPWSFLVHGCAQRSLENDHRLLLGSGLTMWLQMVGKTAQICTFLQKTNLTVEHFLLRYGSYTMKEDDSPGGEPPLWWTLAGAMRGGFPRSVCSDLWESGAAREGCGCYQLGGLNAHLHCYWHINYLCQGDSEGKGFWGSNVVCASGYGLVFAQICPLGSHEASLRPKVKPQDLALMMPAAVTLIAKAAVPSEVPEWILRRQEDLWRGGADFLGWRELCLAVACITFVWVILFLCGFGSITEGERGFYFWEMESVSESSQQQKRKPVIHGLEDQKRVSGRTLLVDWIMVLELLSVIQRA